MKKLNPKQLFELAAKAIPDNMDNIAELDPNTLIGKCKMTLADDESPIAVELNITINCGAMTISFNRVDIDRTTVSEKFSFDDRQKVLEFKKPSDKESTPTN